jgi:formamidopyrimidine-DNA glycosylase
MPELPDITLYLEALDRRCVGQPIEKIRIGGPSLLRSVDPPIATAEGQRVLGTRRIGKRIVLALEDELFLIFHLMIAGRFHWKKLGTALPRKTLAGLDFPTGTLTLSEAGTRKRASLHLASGEQDLAAHDPGGLEVVGSDLDTFSLRLRSANHTLKRSLTDPRLFSGIGNAYSDEILHAARLSPVRLTSKLDDKEIERLHRAIGETLETWTERLREETGDGFPEKVTAFREGMAVHGRFNQPCPRCDAPIQRIVHARSEVNYCAPCQTGGRLLADRALSRLLKKDWPRSIEEMEARKASD